MGAAASDASAVGLVTHIVDGDTLHWTSGDRRRVIRIVGIDAPEMAQPFGEEARHSLMTLCFRRQARVELHKTDPFGRDVATVTLDGADVGLAQILGGWAWHFKRYAKEQSPADRARFAAAEVEARLARRGLWSQLAPVPPWNFRARVRA